MTSGRDDVRAQLRRAQLRPRYALPGGWGPHGGPRGSGAAGGLAVWPCWHRLVTNRMVSVQFVAVGDQTATPRVARPGAELHPRARRTSSGPAPPRTGHGGPRAHGPDGNRGATPPGLTGVGWRLCPQRRLVTNCTISVHFVAVGDQTAAPGSSGAAGRCHQCRWSRTARLSTQCRGTRLARRSCRRRPSPGAR